MFKNLFTINKDYFKNVIQFEENEKNKDFYLKISKFFDDLKGADEESQKYSFLNRYYIFQKV